MRRAPLLAVLALLAACAGGGSPVATPTSSASPTAAATPSDGCALSDPLADANTFANAGRTRRALRLIAALPPACATRTEVKARTAALEASLAVAPSPAGDPATLQREAAALLATGDAALDAGRDADAKSAFEKSWTTWHPNGPASARLGLIMKKSDPVAAQRLFERAATELGALSVDAIDAAAPVRSLLSPDAKTLVVAVPTTVTIVQGGVPRATFPVKNPPRSATFGDGEVTLDDGKTITRWDWITGRSLDSRKSDYESEAATIAIEAIDDGYRFVDPKSKARLGEVVLKNARTLPAFAGGGGHVYFIPDPPETITTETRTVQVHDDVGSHPKQAQIKTHRSSPTLVHATLEKGKVVKKTLGFSCVKSDGPVANPSFFSYTGINENDRCDEPYRATTSEDGSLTVVEHDIASGGYHMTGAITVTDFGAKRTDLTAPEDQGTNAVALSKDGALLAWQFGGTTRLYATKTMKVVWETTKLPSANHALFSADATKLVLTGATEVATVDVATGNVVTSIPSRVPLPPKAMTASASGLAFVVGESVAFVGPEGIAHVPATAPIDALRLAPRADRVVALSGGRPTLVLMRSGFVAKLAPTSVTDAVFSVDGSKLVLAEANELKLYDSTTGALEASLAKTRDPIRTVAWYGDRITLGSGDELSTYDTKAKSTTSIHVGSPIAKLAFSTDGSTLLALTNDKGKARVFAYDATGKERFNLSLDGPPDGLVAFSDRFAAATTKELRVSRTGDGHTLLTGPSWTPPMIAATSTRLVQRLADSVILRVPAEESGITLTFLPRGHAVATEGPVTEIFGGAARCRAGALLLPIEVCDGILAEGTFVRSLR